MQTNKVSVKLNVGEELRRFYFEGTSFDELRSSCTQYLPQPLGAQSNVQLQYQDDENEWVTFSSDAELQYAMSLIHDSPQKLLRLRMNVIDGIAPSSQSRQIARQEQSPQGVVHRDLGEDSSSSSEEGEIPSTVSGPLPMLSGRGRRGRGRGIGRVGGAMRERLKKKLLDARFLHHTSFPDNSTLAPATAFEKTWSLFNSGQISWPAGSTLLCIDRQNVFSAVPTNICSITVAPNSEANITVSLKTPQDPGLYQSYFKLITPEGKKFGQRLRCQIFVSDPEAIVQ